MPIPEAGTDGRGQGASNQAAEGCRETLLGPCSGHRPSASLTEWKGTGRATRRPGDAGKLCCGVCDWSQIRDVNGRQLAPTAPASSSWLCMGILLASSRWLAGFAWDRAQPQKMTDPKAASGQLQAQNQRLHFQQTSVGNHLNTRVSRHRRCYSPRQSFICIRSINTIGALRLFPENGKSLSPCAHQAI